MRYLGPFQTNLPLDVVHCGSAGVNLFSAYLNLSVPPKPRKHERVATELMRCLAQLGPDQQECIMLRFMHGLSISKTAALMGRNDDAVKALQHQPLGRLKQLLPEK
jgi:DNA-directed RNA polymerase specialized sigma24 family protein